MQEFILNGILFAIVWAIYYYLYSWAVRDNYKNGIILILALISAIIIFKSHETKALITEKCEQVQVEAPE